MKSHRIRLIFSIQGSPQKKPKKNQLVQELGMGGVTTFAVRLQRNTVMIWTTDPRLLLPQKEK